MKELIEKIEACGYNEESDLPDEARHFNYGLEKAIAILKAELARLPLNKCPVCEGRGKVLLGFYTQGMPLIANSGTQPCKSCKGKGYIESEVQGG